MKEQAASLAQPLFYVSSNSEKIWHTGAKCLQERKCCFFLQKEEKEEYQELEASQSEINPWEAEQFSSP